MWISINNLHTVLINFGNIRAFSVLEAYLNIKFIFGEIMKTGFNNLRHKNV